MKLSRSSLSILVGVTSAFFCLMAAAMCYAVWDIVRPRPSGPVTWLGEPTATTSAPAADTSPTPPPTPFEIPASACPGPDQLNVLVLGLDSREHNYEAASRADSISAVSVDFRRGMAAMLGIPRDLWVALPDVPNHPEDRINTAYLYGEGYDLPGGGPALTAQTVTLNFGVRLDRYVVIDFQAFVQAVDALRGIDLVVPKAIYDDRFPADDGIGVMLLEIPAGLQHMDGTTALRYARTRHQDNDFERIRRQQAVMLAVLDRALSPQVLPGLPALIQALYGSVRTDLSLTEIAGLACVARTMDRTAIRSYVIDANYVIPWTTEAGAAVQIPNRDAIAPLVAEFNGE